MKSIIKVLITALVVVVLSSLFPGVHTTNYFTAICVALAISILNMFVRPILVFLTLPATILSLGLFLFVINACIVLLADKMVDGFYVSGFWTALFFSICLSFFRSFLLEFVKDDHENNQKG